MNSLYNALMNWNMTNEEHVEESHSPFMKSKWKELLPSLRCNEWGWNRDEGKGERANPSSFLLTSERSGQDGFIHGTVSDTGWGRNSEEGRNEGMASLLTLKVTHCHLSSPFSISCYLCSHVVMMIPYPILGILLSHIFIIYLFILYF